MNYKLIQIFTSEDARCHGKPLSDVMLTFVRGLKVAARCLMTR